MDTWHQTAGRGQIGSSWHGTAGKNIHLSVILYPHWLAAREGFQLSQAAALAVADTIALAGGEHPRVKWPNDVYLGQKKVAGILVRNSLAGGRIQWSIVGIGMNINEAPFPVELPNATSLALYLGRELDLSSVKVMLYNQLEKRYLQLRNQTAALQRAYLDRLYRYREPAAFERTATGETFYGQISGIAPGGELIIEHASGEREAFAMKAIRFQ